jgi:glutamate N-acetyltransferase / amino-acid N-acetyltransferase
VRLHVSGAHDKHEAEAVARAVANSPLVKTAFYGRDPNWGRIVQAVGQAVGRLRPGPLTADISYEDVTVMSGGHEAELGDGQRERLTAIMHSPEIALDVALNGPGASATIYFSDLTHDYVTLNAEYTT